MNCFYVLSENNWNLFQFQYLNISRKLIVALPVNCLIQSCLGDGNAVVVASSLFNYYG